MFKSVTEFRGRNGVRNVRNGVRNVRNGDFAVIFILNVKTSKNGHGGCRYRFVTAAIPVPVRFLKPWVLGLLIFFGLKHG